MKAWHACLPALLLLGGYAAAQAPTLEQCDQRVQSAPKDPGSYWCYVQAAHGSGRFEDAMRRLEAILAVDPQLHRARLNLAILQSDRGLPAAEATYVDSIDRLEAAGDAWGVVYARTALASFLHGRRRFEESEPQIARALEIAAASGDHVMLAHARARAAAHANELSDYGRALDLYLQAEAAIFPDGPGYLQSWVVSGLARVYWSLGQNERAMATYRRELEIKQRSGDRYGEASVRYNMALIAGRFFDDRRMSYPELRELIQQAIQAGAASGNLSAEGDARLMLAQRLEPAEAIPELRHALTLLERSGDGESVRFARRVVLKTQFMLRPDGREELLSELDELIVEARQTGDRFAEARGLVLRAGLRNEAGYPRDGQVAAWTDALDAIERIRDLQPEGSIRARSFGEWAFAYYRFAGYLLRERLRSPSPDDDLELAFQTLERMRARVLLDSMDGSGATSRLSSRSLHGERDELLERLAATQKELLDPSLAATRRRTLLTELERIEADEAVHRDRIARADPRFARRHAPRIPTLARVRELLGPNQVMLAFQLHEHSAGDVAPEEHSEYGGSWVLVISAEQVQAIPLPDRPLVAERVSLYRGLFAARDGSEARAAVRLYDDLLAAALEPLPESISGLVIVADGVLHDLPFGSLRPSAGAPQLARRFEISYAPSATLWARWKAASRNPSTGAVLGLADPSLEVVDSPAEAREADPWLAGLRLGPLPRAVGETRSIVRRLGPGGQLLHGTQASEHALKHEDLSGFGVLHVAAHAVIDRERPERSALVLAGGDPAEDGLLQAREIVELDLDDKLVILSACRSASGEIIAGEGIIGLSRAFFEAGARTVVAAQWPLRDDDAAALIDAFSRELARGHSVAAALARARRSRIAAGAPTVAWAGLVVLGDGDLVPLPGGRERTVHPAAWIVGALLLYTILRQLWRAS